MPSLKYPGCNKKSPILNIWVMCNSGSKDWFPSVRSPCFQLPLSLQSDTHILYFTRGYRLSMPVNGSLCNYDYVEPCAPGAGLSHIKACFQSRKNTVKHQTTQTEHLSLYLSSRIKK